MSDWHWAEGPGTFMGVRASEHAKVYQAGRDLIMQTAGPAWRIDTLPLRDRRLVARQQNQPSKLLRTRDEIVEFTGRRRELDGFAAWRDRTEKCLIRLVHGPGGEGKTRMAAQIAREWKRDGWAVLRARQGVDCLGEAPGIAARTDGATGVLIVLDYAERWPEQDLLGLVGTVETQWKVPVRILLLSRPAGPWWQRMSHLIDKRTDREPDSVRLVPLGIRPADRADIFRSARAAFAACFGLDDPADVPLPAGLESDPSYSLVLTVHMAALVAVDAYHRGSSAPTDPSVLSAYLLRRERDYWASLHESGRAGTDADSMACTVYAASLCGPVMYNAGLSLLPILDIASGPQTLRRLISDHALCYPPVSQKEASVLEPLHPDRLAEDFIALTLPGHDIEHPADPWATSATAKMLSPAAEDLTVNVRKVLTTLIEMAVRWPHIARTHLSRILIANPAVILSAENASMVTLAGNKNIDVAVLEALEPHLVAYRGTYLSAGIAAILNRIAEHRLESAHNPLDRAVIYHGISTAYHFAQLYGQAAVAARQEVDVRRELAILDPTAHRPALAGTLLGLSGILIELKLYDEAFAAAGEALRIRDEIQQAAIGSTAGAGGHFEILLFAPTGVPFETALAISLLHYSDWAYQQGRAEQASAVTEEAVALLRRLAGQDPGSVTDLALALGSQARLLSDERRLDAALRSAMESAKIYREVSAGDDEYTWYLASILNDVSIILDRSLRSAEAATAAQEAVTICRARVEAESSYESMLAFSLLTLSNSLANSDPRRAMDASTESLKLYRKLHLRTSTYDMSLAQAFNLHTGTLIRRGLLVPAAMLARESVDFIRRFVPGQPEILVRALSNTAETLLLRKESDGALEAVDEAAGILEGAVDRSLRSAFVLADILCRKSYIMGLRGEFGESFQAIDTALSLYRRASASYGPHRRLELYLRATHLRALVLTGQFDAGAAAVDGLVDDCRAAGPEGEVWLASVLCLAGELYMRTERVAEVVALMREALPLMRRKSVELPMLRIELGQALHVLGTALFMEESYTEGLSRLEEAVAVFRDCYRTSPGVFPALIGSMSVLGYAYGDRSLNDRALSTTRDAVALADSHNDQGASAAFTVPVYIAFAAIRLELEVDLPAALRSASKAATLAAALRDQSPLVADLESDAVELVGQVEQAIAAQG